MSHFATLVIHKEGADIDEILAPFCETDEEFFEFYDFTDKLKKEYSTDTAKRVKMPDGKYYDCGDKIFAKEVSKTGNNGLVWYQLGNSERRKRMV